MKKLFIFTLLVVTTILGVTNTIDAAKRKATGKATTTKTTTSIPKNQLMLYTSQECFVGVKDGQAWGMEWAKGFGWVGLGVKAVGGNKISMILNDKRQTATVTPTAINFGSVKLKRNDKCGLQIYQSNDWVLLMNPKSDDNTVVLIYQISNPDTFYLIDISDYSSNGFAINYIRRSTTAYDSFDDIEPSMPIYVMKQGGAYHLMDTSITGSEETFVPIK